MEPLFHTAPFPVQPQQYDCTIGRFLSLDPLMDKFPEMSPYSYANNNPISFKDPTGLEPEGEKGKDEVQTQEDLSWIQFMKMENQSMAELGYSMILSNLNSLMGLWDYTIKRNEYLDSKGGGGGAGSSGTRIGVRLKGTPDEVAKIKQSLEKQTGSTITLNKDGYIISIKENCEIGPKNPIQEANRMKLIEMNNCSKVDIMFVDKKPGKSSASFDPLGKSNNGIPTVSLDRNIYFSNKSELDPYTIMYGDEYFINEGKRNLERAFSHEFFGHAYFNMAFGQFFEHPYDDRYWQESETFAVISENYTGLLFNEPFRVHYNTYNFERYSHKSDLMLPSFMYIPKK